MNAFISFFSPAKLTGLLLILLGIILSPLINDFPISIPWIGGKQLFPGLNSSRLAWLICNIGISRIAFSKESYEDERIERIKNYALKNSLFFLLIMAMLLAFHSTKNYELLIITAITQIHYFILVRVCIYRDSTVIYLKEDELKDYNKKAPIRLTQVVIYSLLIGAVAGVIGATFRLDRSLGHVICMCTLIYKLWNNVPYKIQE